MYYDCHHRSFSLIQLKQLVNFPMLATFTKLKYFHFSTANYHHTHSNSICTSHLNGSVAYNLFATMLVNISQRFALIACLYVIHFNLSKSRQTMADDKNETTPVVVPECGPPIDLVVDPTWLEKVVFGDFRIWHILFSGMAIFTGVTIVLCCLFRCRIPRTKQEIEADFLRKRITESFRSHLEKIKIDELQGQYDTGNLLPLFKKVELFEEDRLQKNEGFRRRKLTWRQKLKRIFTGKDPIEEYGDRSLDDSKGEGGTEYTKMTEEEMETIEKEVEGAKTDTSALNMINDQIAIFGFIGESKKDRMKRIKEEKKAEKAARKEQKAQEKLEKKMAKQQPRKSIASSSSSARAKSAKALMELRPDSLEKDQLQWKEHPEMRVSLENGGDSIVIDIEDRGDVILSPLLPPFDTEPKETQETQEESDVKGYREFSLDIPEQAPPKKSSSFASRFSFRDTVNKLIHFGGKPKQKEELVINIGLVRKDDEVTPPMSPTIVSIPHIECSPPDSQDYGQDQPSDQQHSKRKTKKLVKKDSDMTKEESQDRNLLQIPEISKSTKEINTDRKSKEKDGKKKKQEDKRKEKESKAKEKKVKTEKPSKADKHKEKAKVEILETPSYIEEEKTKKTKSKEKLAKPEKDDSSKRSLLKRQTGKEDGQVEKVKLTSDPEKKEKISKSKEHKEKFEAEPSVPKDVKEKDKKLKKKQKDASNLPNLEKEIEKETKSKVKQKDEKLEHLKDESKKTKKKQLEFDDQSIEQTQMALRETKKPSSLKSDRRLENFPMVVEEVKTRQRKEKKEPSSGRRSPVVESPKKHIKEHHSPKKHHSSKTTTSKSDETAKLPKAGTSKDASKQKDFNQMITSLNEELKEAVDQRRKKQLKRSKTIVEDGITPQVEEKTEKRPRSRDEFKKRLSEALLQRIPLKSDVKESLPPKVAAKPSRHVRIVTKQATSSSEIEIPVEHVYTQGALSVSHLQSPSHQSEHLRTPDEAFSQLPVRISTPPPLPSPTHSTISVTTDNIVKKLVESSPETGENRELTYERSRDVIFSVDQSFAHRDEPQPSTSSTTTTTTFASAKPKRSEIKSIEASSTVQTPSESPSKRHRTKDKTKKKKKEHKDH